MSWSSPWFGYRLPGTRRTASPSTIALPKPRRDRTDRRRLLAALDHPKQQVSIDTLTTVSSRILPDV
jgi:hypothetical protein